MIDGLGILNKGGNLYGQRIMLLNGLIKAIRRHLCPKPCE